MDGDNVEETMTESPPIIADDDQNVQLGRRPKGPTRRPTPYPTGFPTEFPTPYPSWLPTKYPTTIHQNLPCPPGMHHYIETEVCIPCNKGRYNHGGMPYLRGMCYDIPEYVEYEYLNITDVVCRAWWIGAPIYEDGEYNEGCVDAPEPTPKPPTQRPTFDPTFPPTNIPTFGPTAIPTTMPSVNGGWTPWGKCVPLQGDCGMGIQNRSCTNPVPKNGGGVCLQDIRGISAPSQFKYCNIPCSHKNSHPIVTMAPSTIQISTTLTVVASIVGVLGLFGLFYIYKIIRRYRCTRRRRIVEVEEERGVHLQTRHNPRANDDVVQQLPDNDSLRVENIINDQ